MEDDPFDPVDLAPPGYLENLRERMEAWPKLPEPDEYIPELF